MEPKQKALKFIKHALDAIEELRHLNPDGVTDLVTHSGKLAYPSIKGGEFDAVLKKIFSRGVAVFTESLGNSAMGWGTNELSIKNIDWVKFDAYRAELAKELRSAALPAKKVTKVNSGGASKPNPPFTVGGDYVAGDKIGRDKHDSGNSNSFSYWTLALLVAIVGGVMTLVIYEGKLPKIFELPQLFSTASSEASVATTTLNILTILNKNFTLDTSLEQQAFIDKYRDKVVYGNGEFKDVSKSDESYYLYMYVGRYPVACSFLVSDAENEVKERIELLRNGDRVSFTGIFTGGGLWSASIYVQDPWYVQDCNFI